MTGVQFAATYLDPPSGILWAARTPMRDQAGGWPNRVRYHRGAAADALRSARRCRVMGMGDAAAIAATPAWMIRRLTQCSLAKDATGALIAPNILTDFQAMTGIEAVPQ
jgi:hypothetical protein